MSFTSTQVPVGGHTAESTELPCLCCRSNYSNTELLKVVSKKILKKRMWAKKMRNSSDIGIFKNYCGSLTWEGV